MSSPSAPALFVDAATSFSLSSTGPSLKAALANCTYGQVAIGVATIVLIAAILEQLNFYRKASKLNAPGPKWVVPFIGGIVTMVQDAYGFWHAQFGLDKRMSWTSIVGQFTLVVTEAPLVRKIFQSCSDRMPLALHPNAYTLLGRDNIAFLNGPEHRALRARLLPLFTSRALEMYVLIQVKAIREYLDRWNKLNASATNPLPMRTMIYDLNTYTSMSVFMGPYLTPESRAQLCADYTLLTEGMYGMPINLPGFALYNGACARPRILAALEKIVDASKARMSQPGAESECLLDFWMVVTLDAIKDGKDLAHTDTPACAKVLLDFIFASQDASTSSLTFSTHYLSTYPDVLAKVRAEVEIIAKQQKASGVAPDPLGTIHMDVDVLRGLTYTGQVIREVLRICPPATIVPHHTVEAFQLDEKTRIPAGTLVVPSVWNSNRTGFSNPESFDPDRFSEERAEHKTFADQFLTFGVGPHVCMGQRYAMNHLTLYVALLAHEHNFKRQQTPNMHKIKYLPTIYPEDDCPLEAFTARE